MAKAQDRATREKSHFLRRMAPDGRSCRQENVNAFKNPSSARTRVHPSEPMACNNCVNSVMLFDCRRLFTPTS
jgi:hypothetical protein